MYFGLAFLCMLAGVVMIGGFVYALIRRRRKSLWVYGLVLSIIGFFVFANLGSHAMTPEERAAKRQLQIEAKARAEAETQAQAKAEADAKAKGNVSKIGSSWTTPPLL